jgi:zinc protease
LEKALFAEVERLKNEPVTVREMEKAKNQITASFILGLDSNFFRAMQIGQAETVGAGYDYVETFVDAIRKVKAEDIRRVVRTYLTEDRRTVGILAPLPPGQERKEPN